MHTDVWETEKEDSFFLEQKTDFWTEQKAKPVITTSQYCFLFYLLAIQHTYVQYAV